MENQRVVEEVSVEMVQLVLREYLGDETANITGFSIEPMQHDGHGGNDIYCAKASWTSQGRGTNSANWVIKHWRPGGLTGLGMGVTSPVEALAWDHGLIRPESLPSGLVVPFVGVILDEERASARIVMEDISEELNAYARRSLSPGERLKRDQLILDGLARFHTHWEPLERFARLEEHSWLLPQEVRLECAADFFSQFLGRMPQKTPFDPTGEKARTDIPDFFDWAREGVLAFLDWLPEADRGLWEEHLCDRQPLIEAFSTLPRTLLHGDTDPRNVGLRWRGDRIELLLIDWEWIGTGSPALDVVHFIDPLNNTDFAQSLSEHYFGCYIAYGGRAMDRPTWERAYHLALIYDGLWNFPYFAGHALDKGSEAVEQTKRKTEHITQAMRRWLPHKP